MAQKQPPYVGGVGTIGVGGTTFTVTGALDDTNCIEGDHVRDPATGYESRVLERLTVQTFRVPPWRGAALAGAAYELYPDSNLRGGYQAAVTTQLLARLAAKGLVWILPPEFATPIAAKWGADEGQYVFSPSLKLWWIMQAGAWTPTGAPYGMMATNALSEIAGLGLSDIALVNLGSTVTGRGLFKADSPAGARSTLGLIKQASLSDATLDRVMTTGAFGLGKSVINLGNADDARVSRPTGFYYCSSSIGTPAAANGWLFVQQLDANYCTFQFVVADGTGDQYVGSLYNGTFLGWKRTNAASGSNSVGNWYRFPDGMLLNVQRTTLLSTAWTNSSYGSYASLGNIGIPSSFTTPYAGIIQISDGAVSARAGYSTYFTLGTSAFNDVYLASPQSAPAGTQVTLHMISLGRQ